MSDASSKTLTGTSENGRQGRSGVPELSMHVARIHKDYPEITLFKPTLDAEGAVCVMRRCDGGCDRTLRFYPRPDANQPHWCSACAKLTNWEVTL